MPFHLDFGDLKMAENSNSLLLLFAKQKINTRCGFVPIQFVFFMFFFPYLNKQCAVFIVLVRRVNDSMI